MYWALLTKSIIASKVSTVGGTLQTLDGIMTFEDGDLVRNKSTGICGEIVSVYSYRDESERYDVHWDDGSCFQVYKSEIEVNRLHTMNDIYKLNIEILRRLKEPRTIT